MGHYPHLSYCRAGDDGDDFDFMTGLSFEEAIISLDSVLGV